MSSEDRFWTQSQMVPGTMMPTSAAAEDDPIDEVVDTVGVPRNMVDLDQFSSLFIWED